MKNELQKLAVITGASAGIGRVAAEAFVADGWQVLCLSRSPCSVPGVVHRRTDLLESGWGDALEAWLDADSSGLVGNGPRVVCLVHNAGMMVKDTALEMDAESLRHTLEVNVVAPAVLNRIFRKRMGSGSSILYIGSTLSEKAIPGTASYVTSKHAVAGLMKCTCQDLAGTLIHTACICPGITATEMLLTHLGGDSQIKEKITALHTMGRLIEPKEIAAMIRFCADNPVVNGSVLHVNLGQVER